VTAYWLDRAAATELSISGKLTTLAFDEGPMKWSILATTSRFPWTLAI